ncbi:MAG: hypothetical protein S4CHLAM2_03310 [Chlamydiales bacterium]|nr:hypothetical protein [Chlamydiales bacterium]
MTSTNWRNHRSPRQQDALRYPYQYSPPKGNKKGMQTRVGLAAGAGLLILALAGALAATYFLSPGAHAWTNTQLAVGKGLYMIGLPAAGLMTGIGICLYAHAKYKARKQYTFRPHDLVSKGLTETQKNAMKVGALVTLAVLLAIGVSLAYHFCPQVPQALDHQLTIGQNMLYIGLPTLGAGALVNGALVLNRRRQAKQALTI